MIRLIIMLSIASLATMTVVDCRLGPRAEFINAWSVIERLVGRSPEAGNSLVAERFGAFGEFVAVVAANLAIGTLLALVALFVGRILR